MTASDHGRDRSSGGNMPPGATASHIGFATSQSPRLVADFLHEAGDWTDFAAIEDTAVAAIHAVAAHVEIGPEAQSVTIVFSDDAHVRSLNLQWRGQDKPTNVLSFPAVPQELPADRPSHVMLHLGDIVLAAETVVREANEQALSPRHHLSHLVVHGVLHLLGYDHMEPNDADEMEQLEAEILASLGIADPYAGTEPVAAPS